LCQDRRLCDEPDLELEIQPSSISQANLDAIQCSLASLQTWHASEIASAVQRHPSHVLSLGTGENYVNVSSEIHP